MSFQRGRKLSQRAERGQALIMMTLGTTFLLGLLGLVVDVGYGYYLKQEAQAVADAAALAAAVEAQSNGYTCGTAVLCESGYSCPANPTNDTNFGVGCLYARTNGFSGNSVTLSSGTSAIGGANVNYWVTAKVSAQMPTLFTRVIGAAESAAISAQSTGGVLASWRWRVHLCSGYN
jgi:uncharacterized membrane protein